MSDYNQQSGYDPNQQNQQYNPTPPYPQQPMPQQQYPAPVQWPHMKLGDWIVTQLLMLIPIANIVLVFMWAFGKNVNPSKKTYFQASLIWMAIGVLLGVLLGTLLVSVFASLFASLY